MTTNTNRQSIVKGQFVNVAEQTFQPFECITAYTRSKEKAAKMLEESNIVPAGCIAIVTEIVNEKASKPVYDANEIFALAPNMCDSIESAQEAKTKLESENEIPYTVHEMPVYRYDGVAWIKYQLENGTIPNVKYETVPLRPIAPKKFTKRARLEFFRDFAETSAALKNGVVLSIDLQPTKTETAYFVIAENDLASCKVPETR